MKTGRDTGNIAGVVTLKQFVYALHHLRQERLNFRETLLPSGARLGYLKNFAFRFVEQLRRRTAHWIICRLGDIRTNRHQFAHD